MRQDKFRDVIILDRCYVQYSPGRFDPDEREFRFIYSKLFESPEFRGLVERLSGEGLELRDVYTSTTFNRISDYMIATFIGGSGEVHYEIDSDLNFKKL